MQAAKVAVLATVVYIYNHPEVLTQYARAEGEVFDADVENARAKALQFLLTSVSYVLALMFSPRTFLVIVVILLQISCWGMLMINTRFLPVEGIDVKTEKVVLAWASSALYTILLLLTLFGGRHESREEKFRKRLTTFYKKHNPSKLDEIEQIMEKYHDNEDLLFTRLHRKYNALAWEARRADDQQEDSPDDSTGADADASNFEEDGDDEGDDNEEETQPEAAPQSSVAVAEHKFQSSSSPQAPQSYRSVEEEVDDDDDDESFELIGVVPASTSTGAPQHAASAPSTSSTSPPSGTTSARSDRVKAAIEEARREQQRRIEMRIAQLHSKGKR